jgi:hypothetical protein
MAEFIRNAEAEARAIARGTATAAEIERRGGVNKSGYYGDSFDPEVNLSDEEYAAAGAKGGGIAINAATQARQKAVSSAKLKAKFIADGLSEADAQKKVDELYASLEAGQSVDTNGNVISDSTTSNQSLTMAEQLALDGKREERKSAYDLLYSEFKQYGLEALVTPLKSLIEEGVSPSEFTLRLRETDAYKKRFAANAQRVAKGLRALSEAEYIGTEDQYQDVMRRYGMPESYYSKGDLGVQSGFEKFLAGDVSAVELEDRIQTAQNRVVNSNPEVAKALKEFYPGISNGDILAYVLDPANAIEQIKRKVTAAEIGGAAIQSGLTTGMTRAEELAAAGITKQQAQQGFQTVAEVAPRGGMLADIYKQSPYTQTTAEQEVFGLAGSVDAAKQRKKLTQLETAAFSGSAGSGAIARERAGSF